MSGGLSPPIAFLVLTITLTLRQFWAVIICSVMLQLLFAHSYSHKQSRVYTSVAFRTPFPVTENVVEDTEWFVISVWQLSCASCLSVRSDELMSTECWNTRTSFNCMVSVLSQNHSTSSLSSWNMASNNNNNNNNNNICIYICIYYNNL